MLVPPISLRSVGLWKMCPSIVDGLQDEVAEWLRRWTANPLGSPRVGSNPIFGGNIFQNDLHQMYLYSVQLQCSYLRGDSILVDL